VVDRLPITAANASFRDMALPALRSRAAHVAASCAGADARAAAPPSRRWNWGAGAGGAAALLGAPPSLLSPAGFESADGWAGGGGSAAVAPPAAAATLPFRGPGLSGLASHSGAHTVPKLADVEYLPRMTAVYRDRRPGAGDRERDRVVVDEREEAAVRTIGDWFGVPVDPLHVRHTLTDRVYGYL
jgi:hypothetical protein